MKQTAIQVWHRLKIERNGWSPDQHEVGDEMDGGWTT